MSVIMEGISFEDLKPDRPPDEVRFEKGKAIYTWRDAVTGLTFPDGSKIHITGNLELTVNDPTIMGPGETPSSVITIIPENL